MGTMQLGASNWSLLVKTLCTRRNAGHCGASLNDPGHVCMCSVICHQCRAIGCMCKVVATCGDGIIFKRLKVIMAGCWRKRSGVLELLWLDTSMTDTSHRIINIQFTPSHMIQMDVSTAELYSLSL